MTERRTAVGWGLNIAEQLRVDLNFQFKIPAALHPVLELINNLEAKLLRPKDDTRQEECV